MQEECCVPHTTYGTILEVCQQHDGAVWPDSTANVGVGVLGPWQGLHSIILNWEKSHAVFCTDVRRCEVVRCQEDGPAALEI